MEVAYIRRMSHALHEPPQYFMDLLLDAVCVVDRESRFLFISAAGERIFGYPPDEMIGRPVLDFVHPEDRERTRSAIREILDGEQKPHFENRYLRKDGKTAHIMWSARWSARDQVRIAVARDITERKRAESLQRAIYAISEAANRDEGLLTLFQGIDATLRDLLPIDDLVVTLVDADTGEAGCPWPIEPDDPGGDPERELMRQLGSVVAEDGEALLLTPDSVDATKQPFDTPPDALNHIAVPLESGNGVVGSLVARADLGSVRFSDEDRNRLQLISVQIAAAIERRVLHLRLERMARYDQLTGLPNRALFLDRLATAVTATARKQAHLAVLYLDLDEFKHVNDTFGHAAGDQLLKEVAHRLTDCIRGADTVGRLGGDEFVVLLEGIERVTDGATIAKKIAAAFAAPFGLAAGTVQVSSSIGIAVYPEDGLNADELIGHADTTMYRAKRSQTGTGPGWTL
ncbi:GGDEF domain-containing protein [Halofilum ochraceum]|uniref:GGDEF domain-containing protein n=1 Tax=Halofilum ochraceum TaxID=1611323 RepID=UPI000AFA929D|nr:GGDEF domain-containing protein [Halofilum ochraceum]